MNPLLPCNDHVVRGELNVVDLTGRAERVIVCFYVLAFQPSQSAYLESVPSNVWLRSNDYNKKVTSLVALLPMV